MSNVFVIGLDPFNLQTMRHLREARRYDFHGLLPLHKVRLAPSYDYDALLRDADEQLQEFGDPVDAVLTWWDFPCTSLVPVISERWDLPGPELRHVVSLEHKYWSRLVQRMVAPEHVPSFAAFDPFSEHCLDDIRAAGIDFPFWVKPVKSVRSYLGFRVDRPADFDSAIGAIRSGIGLYGDPFQQALSRVHDRPHEIDHVGGNACVAETLVGGRQCTLEGYVVQQQVHLYGTVDSIRRPGTSTFQAYRYPSTLPAPIQAQMEKVASDVIVASGLDQSCFNIEFFYDEDRGRIWLLEVNVRLSQSHCELFAKVDGASSQRVMLDVAGGRLPRMPQRQGDHAYAQKVFLRTTDDGVVRSIPAEQDIAAVTKRFPDARVHIEVEPGQRLSRLSVQESYSYELGRVFVGADDRDRLDQDIEEIEDLLPFDIEPVGSAP